MVQYETKIKAEHGKQEIFVTRMFNAPRGLVFRAHVEPELQVKWRGPKKFTMDIDKFEPRSGGSYRIVHHDEDGNEFAFHGVYHEVTLPVRIVDTFEFEGLNEPGHVILETLKFEELNDGTTEITSHMIFPSVTFRDGMLESGMESGVNESYERLDDLLENLID
jgi:uncharacterized protein YndB with AHSA1/START domain